MTKFAKLSLVAALAITAANAQDLEQAIKGVDVSGSVGVQYNNTEVNAATPTSTDGTVYNVQIGTKVKAADDVTLTVGVSTRAETTTADTDAPLGVGEATFTYTGVKDLTVIAGKQPLNTPWTQGTHAVDATQSGTGVMALYNAGFATVAGAHFINNGIDSSTGAKADITESALNVAAVFAPIANIGNLEAWYINVGNGITNDDYTTSGDAHAVDKGGDAMSIALNGKVAGVSYDARYSTLELNADGAKENSLMKVTLKGNVAGVDLTGAYAETAKDGGLVAFDSDGSAGFKGFQTDLNGKTDANARLVAAAMPVLPNMTASLTYIDLEAENKDYSETYAQVSYKFSKQLSAYVRYGTYSDDSDAANDSDKGRFEAVYKF